MKRNTVFTTSISSQLKAIAMIFMLVHHLWVNDVITSAYGLSEASWGGGYLLRIGALCKICVGIFMFISGYGLMNLYSKGKYNILHSIKKTILPFWFVLLLYVPCISIYRHVSVSEILGNALILSHSINGSWWFLQTYLIFVCLVPLFAYTMRHRCIMITIALVSCIFFQYIGTQIRPFSDGMHYVLHYFPIFYIGMIANKEDLINRLSAIPLWKSIPPLTLIIILRFFAGFSILNVAIIFALLLLLIKCQPAIPTIIKSTMQFLGKMSMNMWYVHMFFITYCFHFTNPLFDLIIVYCESLMAAFIIDRVYESLSKHINKQ